MYALEVVFGGRDASNTILGDTWTWDGTSWEPVPSGPPSAAREHGAAVFDERRGVVVLFGGRAAVLGRNDAGVLQAQIKRAIDVGTTVSISADVPSTPSELAGALLDAEAEDDSALIMRGALLDVEALRAEGHTRHNVT